MADKYIINGIYIESVNGNATSKFVAKIDGEQSRNNVYEKLNILAAQRDEVEEIANTLATEKEALARRVAELEEALHQAERYINFVTLDGSDYENLTAPDA